MFFVFQLFFYTKNRFEWKICIADVSPYQSKIYILYTKGQWFRETKWFNILNNIILWKDYRIFNLWPIKYEFDVIWIETFWFGFHLVTVTIQMFWFKFWSSSSMKNPNEFIKKKKKTEFRIFIWLLFKINFGPFI